MITDRFFRKYPLVGGVKAMVGIPFQDPEGPFPRAGVTDGRGLGGAYRMDWRMGREDVKANLLFEASVGCLLALTLASSAVAQRELPAPLEATIIGKILIYEQNLHQRLKEGRQLQFTILFGPENPDSERRAEEMAASMTEVNRRSLVAGVDIRVRKVAISRSADVETAIASTSRGILYVCPGLDQFLEVLSRQAQANGCLTIGSKASYVEKGLSFGVFMGRSKPQMMVNLPSSLAEGAKFSSSLLRLATVIR